MKTALHIERKRGTRYDNEPGLGNEYLVVNSIEDIYSYLLVNREGETTAYFYEDDVIREIKKFTPQEVGTFFDYISYQHAFDDSASIVNIEIKCSDQSDLPPDVIVTFDIDFVNWNRPYSIAEFAEEMSLIIKNDKNHLYEYFSVDEDDIITNGFGFKLKTVNRNNTLFDVNDAISNYIKRLIECIKANLINKLDENTLITFFNFPDSIKTACKQYLLYFAQFLMDLGIEADTEITEEAHNTLFRVLPKNTNDSLDRIREALAIYLNAYKADSLIKIEDNNDISIVQWQANILHLKSQLLMANSVIQLKDATIEQLQLSNYQYRNSSNIHAVKNDIDKEEEVIRGILSIKKYDGKGFSVNFAELLRRMKRIF